jgi:hypothetical protein
VIAHELRLSYPCRLPGAFSTRSGPSSRRRRGYICEADLHCPLLDDSLSPCIGRGTCSLGRTVTSQEDLPNPIGRGKQQAGDKMCQDAPRNLLAGERKTLAERKNERRNQTP